IPFITTAEFYYDVEKRILPAIMKLDLVSGHFARTMLILGLNEDRAILSDPVDDQLREVLRQAGSVAADWETFHVMCLRLLEKHPWLDVQIKSGEAWKSYYASLQPQQKALIDKWFAAIRKAKPSRAYFYDMPFPPAEEEGSLVQAIDFLGGAL